MSPTSPVIPGKKLLEIVFTKDQPEYRPLPVLYIREGTTVLTRWRLTWRERIFVLIKGDLYLQQMTFGQPLQLQLPSVSPPQMDGDRHDR